MLFVIQRLISTTLHFKLFSTFHLKLCLWIQSNSLLYIIRYLHKLFNKRHPFSFWLLPMQMHQHPVECSPYVIVDISNAPFSFYNSNSPPYRHCYNQTELCILSNRLQDIWICSKSIQHVLQTTQRYPSSLSANLVNYYHYVELWRHYRFETTSLSYSFHAVYRLRFSSSYPSWQYPQLRSSK